jgi:hypothetical protein
MHPGTDILHDLQKALMKGAVAIEFENHLRQMSKAAAKPIKFHAKDHVNLSLAHVAPQHPYSSADENYRSKTAEEFLHRKWPRASQAHTPNTVEKRRQINLGADSFTGSSRL